MWLTGPFSSSSIWLLVFLERCSFLNVRLAAVVVEAAAGVSGLFGFLSSVKPPLSLTRENNMDRRIKAANKHAEWKRPRFLLSTGLGLVSFRVRFVLSTWVLRSPVAGWEFGGGEEVCVEILCSGSNSEESSRAEVSVDWWTSRKQITVRVAAKGEREENYLELLPRACTRVTLLLMP